MLASCLVAVLLGRHLTPGLWTSENFRKHTNVTNVAYKLYRAYRAQDLYMCNGAMQDLTRHGAKAEREKMTDTIDTIPGQGGQGGQAKGSLYICRFHFKEKRKVIQRGATEFREFREFGQLFRLTKSYRRNLFCTKILQVKLQKKTKNCKRRKKKRSKRHLSFKLCQLHQEVPRDSKQTKAVSDFCFPFSNMWANLQSSGLPDAMLVQITRLSFKIHRI